MSLKITLTVNNRPYTHEVEPRLLLSDLLRHDPGLTGTHARTMSSIGCAGELLW
ncbi:MAG TPA: hypothetical protein VGE45_08620 [Chloroflexia bacterium]|jgi:carbon-monoxide dehydrogenase small subunit